MYISRIRIHWYRIKKQQLELLKEIELKLEELSQDFKEIHPLEVKEIKGIRMVVSSIIRRMRAKRMVSYRLT